MNVMQRSGFERWSRRASTVLPCLVSVAAVLSTAGCLRLKTVATAGAEPPPKMMDTTSRLEQWEVKEETQKSGHFILDGKPLCFSGTNQYYLPWMSRKMTDDVLVTAKEMNLVVMRTWANQERGSLDGSMPNTDDGDGTKNGVYYQYWDPKTGAPAYNDDEQTGLGRLDYVLHKSRELGIKLILTLTNNWKDTGGMDQYVKWYGLKHHHEFFIDERVKAAYKNYAKHLIERRNHIDGTLYRDDPAIFAWELANEPRMINYAAYDSSVGWDKTTMVKWADEMSAYIKSLDSNHMVAVGDEGFLTSGEHWLFEATDGVDHEALTAVKNIDFGTFHVYPDNWQTGLKILHRFIQENLDVGRRVGKPTVLEEYGVVVQRNDKNEITGGWERREVTYKNWNELVLRGGGAGSMFWILSGIMDDDSLYPDYDHYTLYKGDQTHKLLEPYFKRFPTEAQACKYADKNLGAPSPFVKATRMRTVAVLDVSSMFAAVGAVP
ncbi:MAG: cellulase family glycosylhydrolase [Polyangiaceae bacterium]